ncbi:hypothetical protein [Stenotrophomonas sp.]|uniref:hypothetical protein n=1 Tax=Stenotrophomonas sp. TaxID=69392 RepID=UPI0028A95693|nr:hypothetical protein [Stenotrophomonas sp.]
MTRLAAALALTLAAGGAHAANVLSTGFYFDELMQPVKLLLDAGHEVTFATPQQRAGARFTSNTTPWTGHVVVDRELITGQNPASALEVGQRLVERLK